MDKAPIGNAGDVCYLNERKEFEYKKEKEVRVMNEKETMENFFSILAIRKEQYLIAKARYEEAFLQVDKIYHENKMQIMRDIPQSQNLQAGTSISLAPHAIHQYPTTKIDFIDAEEIVIPNEPKQEKFRHPSMINKKTFLEDMIEVFKKTKKTMTCNEMTEALIEKGRIFNSQEPSKQYDSVYAALHASSRNCTGISQMGREKWGLDDWKK